MAVNSLTSDSGKLTKYLVYRREIQSTDLLPDQKSDEKFFLWRLPPCHPSILQAFLQEFGVPGTVKLVAKLLTPSRCFFGALIDKQLASYGWIMHGHCRRYRIEKEASVIGPIYTKVDYRGKGLVVLLMQWAMIKLAARGKIVFYIDASESNAPSHRAIKKAGFIGPVATFDRH